MFLQVVDIQHIKKRSFFAYLEKKWSCDGRRKRISQGVVNFVQEIFSCKPDDWDAIVSGDAAGMSKKYIIFSLIIKQPRMR
jgi:hypothetical protein